MTTPVSEAISSRRRVGQSAVHRDRRARGGRLARDEEQNRVGDVLRRDARLQEVAAAILFLKSFLIQTAGAHAVGSDGGPQAGTARSGGENRVGRDHVDADSEFGELQTGNAR